MSAGWERYTPSISVYLGDNLQWFDPLLLCSGSVAVFRVYPRTCGNIDNNLAVVTCVDYSGAGPGVASRAGYI